MLELGKHNVRQHQQQQRYLFLLDLALLNLPMLSRRCLPRVAPPS